MPSQAQLAQDESPITLHYFGVKAAGGVATLCLEQGNVPYTAKKYDFPAWAEFKPKTPTGLLPILEYPDGMMLPESGAIQRVAAAKAGLLGTGRDYAKSEAIIGICADMMKHVQGNVPTVMTLGDWTPEMAGKWEKDFKPKVKEILEKFASSGLLQGDKASTTGCVLGELELWYKLYQFSNGAYPEVLAEVPSLKAFYDRMSALQGPKKLHENTTQFGELADYFVPIP